MAVPVFMQKNESKRTKFPNIEDQISVMNLNLKINAKFVFI